MVNKVLSFLSPSKRGSNDATKGSTPLSLPRKGKRSLFGRHQSCEEYQGNTYSSSATASTGVADGPPSILKVKSQKASLKSLSTFSFEPPTNNSSNKKKTSTCDENAHANTASAAEATKERSPVVHFDKVDVWYYDTVLCCNPAVSEGPPIALGWKVVESECGVDLDEYEKANPTDASKASATRPLPSNPKLVCNHHFVKRLDCEQREQLLLERGVTRRDIDVVMEEVHFDKWHRDVTRRSVPPKDRRKYRYI